MLQGLPATEVWTQWTGEVVDGLFPLESCIGSSDHSGVYVTENPARNASKAALKLIPALPTSAGLQLARWNTAAGLDHPHLIRLRAGTNLDRCVRGRVFEGIVDELPHGKGDQLMVTDDPWKRIASGQGERSALGTAGEFVQNVAQH